jgi:hypothetical protein
MTDPSRQPRTLPQPSPMELLQHSIEQVMMELRTVKIEMRDIRLDIGTIARVAIRVDEVAVTRVYLLDLIHRLEKLEKQLQEN